MRARINFQKIICLILAGCWILPGKISAGDWDNADPLAVAKRVADRELFGKVINGDTVRPRGSRGVKVHHDWYWRDATLMSGVAALYDRSEEVGHPVGRYLDYLSAWGRHDLGGFPIPIFHGDMVCAGQTYIWLYQRSGKISDHLVETDGMIDFIFHSRSRGQRGTGYNDYWMRFWNDDIHMVPPFLARRGKAAGNQGIPNGKDGRTIAMEYCRAYADLLRDPSTGLFWHDQGAIGAYQWGRGNGWAAAGYLKVWEALKDDPAYAKDAQWLIAQLIPMAETLKNNRNPVGTWNADVLDRKIYKMPETSGSAFFIYMIARLANQGILPPEYWNVALKGWHFLKLSVTDTGELMRVQPVGTGPVVSDFETNSETYGVGAFLLAATEISRIPEKARANNDNLECVKVEAQDLEWSGNSASIELSKLSASRSDFPGQPALKVQAVIPGKRLPATSADSSRIKIDGLSPDDSGPIYFFYQP